MKLVRKAEGLIFQSPDWALLTVFSRSSTCFFVHCCDDHFPTLNFLACYSPLNTQRLLVYGLFLANTFCGRQLIILFSLIYHNQFELPWFIECAMKVCKHFDLLTYILYVTEMHLYVKTFLRRKRVKHSWIFHLSFYSHALIIFQRSKFHISEQGWWFSMTKASLKGADHVENQSGILECPPCRSWVKVVPFSCSSTIMGLFSSETSALFAFKRESFPTDVMEAVRLRNCHE